LIVFLILIGTALGQNNKTNREKKPSKHWCAWESDTTITDQGAKTITKMRYRHMRTTNGWVTEILIFEYDKCNNLAHKTKTRTDAKCFGGEAKVKYKRQYKSKCAL
jgi:hypothetical protein